MGILLTLCTCDLSSSSTETSTECQVQMSSVAIDSDIGQAEIVPPTFELSPEQLADFKRDGYVVIRGLLSGQELKNAVKTAKKLNRIPLVRRLSNMFINIYRQTSFQTWRAHKSMEHIAFDSSVPSIAAQLMDYANFEDDETEASSSQSSQNPPAVRLLRDAFLSYQDGGIGCGWHVDDKGFWPCEDSPLHTPDAGVNVWITLSPLRASEGGGLAVAPSSHAVSWREDARSVIASPTNGPMPLTCAMEDLSPEYHRKFEEMKLTLDMEPGDAIIHDRYMFHRTVQFKDEGKKGLFSRWRKRTKLRISLRYMPSDANLFVINKMFDQAFEEKDLMTGDKIEKGEEYFPQVWPTSLSGERKKEVKKEEGLYTLSFMFKMLKQASKK